MRLTRLREICPLLLPSSSPLLSSPLLHFAVAVFHFYDSVLRRDRGAGRVMRAKVRLKGFGFGLAGTGRKEGRRTPQRGENLDRYRAVLVGLFTCATNFAFTHLYIKMDLFL